MKRISASIIILVGIMVIMPCCNIKNDSTSSDDRGVCFGIIKESKEVYLVEDDNEEDYNTHSNSYKQCNAENPKKLYAEKLISETEERMKNFMAYGRAIQKAASERYSDSKDDLSPGDKSRLYGLANCMGYFNSIQKRFEEYAYKYYYEENYDDAIKVVNMTFDSFRYAYEHYSSELADMHIYVDMVE